MPRPDLAVAVDIGGTFTDVTVQDAGGHTFRAKVPSVPADPSQAFVAGMHAALGLAGVDAASVTRVLHGTTVATNLILEGKGARTALVTTRGFRHVMEIGRQDIPRRANLYAWIKPARPVPPARVLEVDERIDWDGAVHAALDDATVHAAADALRSMGVEAVAVCLLHSFANPVHERRVMELLREALPGIAVTASIDVLPVIREYERSLATVLNAAVMPAVSTYVERLETRLHEAGVRAPLLLMQSNGGVAGAGTIRRMPAVTALSGPAAGVVGARHAAAEAGFDDIITVDIGGTSADIALIAQGQIGLTSRGQVGEWPLPLPMVDMVTIGAGGGSLAVVRDGALLVGPESAGASPGPACYGQGGTRPTLTDAHVVLGHLPHGLLGGTLKLDRGRAVAAVQAGVADPLGITLAEAARGILAIADNAMVGAIRVVSVERGHDPRRFALVAFGGAGPLHGCALAGLLGIPTVIIPAAPGILCAEGLLRADLRASFSQTVTDPALAPQIIAQLETEANAWFEAEQVPMAARELGRVALMRYHGQGGELAVPWDGDLPEAGFVEAHKALYGFTLDAAIELVTLRIEATGRLPSPQARPAPGERGKAGQAEADFGAGRVAVPVRPRGALMPGREVHGPAIVTQLDTTTLVPPGWTMRAEPGGALVLRLTSASCQ